MSNSLNALLATAALALAGITGPLATSASAAAQGSKVILLTVTDECSYCALHKQAFLEEAAKHGLEVEVKINNFDPAEQATQVDQALGEGPDAIVVESDLVRARQVEALEHPPHVGPPHLGGGIAGAVRQQHDLPAQTIPPRWHGVALERVRLS